jgi:hypothetical protein
MKLLALFILVFGGLMIGVVIYPMWKTDRVILTIERESRAGMGLTDILAAHPSFTFLSFSRTTDTDSEPCLTIVNVNGTLAQVVTLKTKRRPGPNEPFNLIREWTLSGACSHATIVYEALYRKGYVFAPVNERLQLTDVVTSIARQ